MKKIEDYLHLYLGCEISYDGKIWTLHMVSNKYAYLRRGKEGTDRVTIHLHEAKPLLRSLSSMTEEELKELEALLPDDESIDTEDMEKMMTQGAATFLWALKKSFDLFNLIADGLAIDSTKTPNPGK